MTVPVTGRLRSNNLSAVLAAARSGLGIAALPRYVAGDSLASGHVVEVLRDYALPAQEIHAVFPSPKLVPGEGAGVRRVPAGAVRRAVVGDAAEGVKVSCGLDAASMRRWRPWTGSGPA